MLQNLLFSTHPYPNLICACSVTSYWLIVGVKSICITKKIGKAPNIIPKEIGGLLSRLVMLPLILCWILYPWHALFFQPSVFPAVALTGSLICISSLVLSMYCWSCMGTSWRIGIDPKEKNPIITHGPFHYIRHPIYTLSMALIFGSFLTLQTQFMFILCCIHWIIFSIEAYREEQYLIALHAEVYAAYMKQTNRFLPFL